MPTTIVAPNKEMDSSSSVPETKENDTTDPTAAAAADAAADPTDSADPTAATAADSTMHNRISSEMQIENIDHEKSNLHPPSKSQPHSPSPSPPPQTSDVEDNSGCEQMEMSDQIMELMRREALRHLEFAWEAERNLVLLCQDQQSPSLSDKTKK